MSVLGRPLSRSFLSREAVLVAPELIGRVLVSGSGAERVAVRITEVEAYAGPADPASHAFRRTARSEIMFGPAGHLYVYFIYGMHWCANVVTGSVGDASAVLLRAGAVVGGLDLARLRRPSAGRDRDLARGPAGLAAALGLTGAATGTDLCTRSSSIRLLAGSGPAAGVLSGPRVGVSQAAERPWRFWEAGGATVSAYRRGTRADRGDPVGPV